MLPKLAVLSRGGVQPKHAKPSTKPPRPPLGTFSYRVGVCIDEALIVAPVAFPVLCIFAKVVCSTYPL